MPSLGSEIDESPQQFEKRKADHIRLSLEERNEALGFSGLDQVELIHEALPNLNFSELEISQNTLNLHCPTPFLVSSMTAGHLGSVDLNRRLAKACTRRGWLMGVGSQRRELYDSSASQEWVELRKSNPQVKLLGNLGLSQLIQTSTDQIRRLVDVLEAEAMIVHTNPLQESMQPEGTPQFAGSLEALERLCKELNVPVVLKETGCGFSKKTLARIQDIGLGAVDVSGYGGTHWGRIEGDRNDVDEIKRRASDTFKHWGISTLESLNNALEVSMSCEVWASGGVRNGLHAATLLAMGAQIVGFAKPILRAALEGEEELDLQMERMEYELKTALFCTGCKTVSQLKEEKVWKWRKA